MSVREGMPGGWWFVLISPLNVEQFQLKDLVERTFSHLARVSV